MLKCSSALNFFLVLFLTAYFSSSNLGENFISDVSFLTAVSLETELEAPLVSSTQIPQFGVFQGKETENTSNYVTSFGIGFDLSVKNKCSKQELRDLLRKLEDTMFKLFKNYGKSKSFEKSGYEQRTPSSRTANKTKHYNRKIKKLNDKTKRLLIEIFGCILKLTAKKYSGRSVRTNEIGCNLITITYFSSLKSTSKVILAALKKTHKQLSEIYNECIKSPEINLSSCYCFGASVSSIEGSISAQNQILEDSKSEKNKCKRYIRNKLVTRLFGRRQVRRSGDVVSKTKTGITTYL
ncbi:uncharacterized protein ELE39_001009 [Cryptosporidium sp. chipmunk genotype I]|uniref:uncharacterized protein n=1 Tax=Cryptosporidium sp. chipmunk genotype I TaxID=1280935 RepID=UPI00351A0799|nr:hypothetical protein ELE39_001009 [Cryptosporidium sp. chipmunk genotype I]